MRSARVAASWWVISLLTSGCGNARQAAKSGYVAVGADRLYYEDSGAGSPVVVLVSGGSGMDLGQWDFVAERLARDHRVVRYDPRGIGKSDTPTARYSDAGDLEALLDRLGLGRVCPIGLSSAGALVLEFALRHPERIEAAVVSAPLVPGFEFSAAMMQRLARFSAAAERGREAFVDAMLEDPHFIPAPLAPAIRERARANMAANFDRRADFDPTLPIPLEPPLLDQLGKIQSGVLLLAGEHDHPEVIRRNRFVAERIASSQERVVADAGHNVPLENPAAFVDEVARFLATLDAR